MLDVTIEGVSTYFQNDGNLIQVTNAGQKTASEMLNHYPVWKRGEIAKPSILVGFNVNGKVIPADLRSHWERTKQKREFI